MLRNVAPLVWFTFTRHFTQRTKPPRQHHAVTTAARPGCYCLKQLLTMEGKKAQGRRKHGSSIGHCWKWKSSLWFAGRSAFTA